MLKDKLLKLKGKIPPPPSSPDNDDIFGDYSDEGPSPENSSEEEDDPFAEPRGDEEETVNPAIAESADDELVAELEKRGYKVEAPVKEAEDADASADI